MRLKEDYEKRRRRRRWTIAALVIATQISMTFAYKVMYPNWTWTTALIGALVTSAFLFSVGIVFYRISLAGRRPKGSIYDRRAGKRNYYDF